MKEYLIKTGFFNRPRKLVLTEDYCEWEKTNPKEQGFIRLNKSDIIDFRHGMDWIVWYKFTVGQQFSIAFKDKRNREHMVQFSSYFGLSKENKQRYSDIVDDIWRLYHSNVVDNFLDEFHNAGQAESQGIKLKNGGIELRGGKKLIPWDKVAMKEYYRYFAIYHRDEPNIHSRVSYNEYGTETLWSAIMTILKGKSKAE